MQEGFCILYKNKTNEESDKEGIDIYNGISYKFEEVSVNHADRILSFLVNINGKSRHIEITFEAFQSFINNTIY